VADAQTESDITALAPVRTTYDVAAYIRSQTWICGQCRVYFIPVSMSAAVSGPFSIPGSVLREQTPHARAQAAATGSGAPAWGATRPRRSGARRAPALSSASAGQRVRRRGMRTEDEERRPLDGELGDRRAAGELEEPYEAERNRERDLDHYGRGHSRRDEHRSEPVIHLSRPFNTMLR
jgi:hypothetical protein